MAFNSIYQNLPKMSVTTDHQFIDTIDARSNHLRMFLGTIHPHRVENFKIPFFYGNHGSLWSRLGEAFPKRDFSSKAEIINNLNQSNIWISDMIRRCDRLNEKVTKDSDLFNLKLNTEQVRQGILNSNPKEPSTCWINQPNHSWVSLGKKAA